MKVIPLTPNFVAEIQEIQLDRITDSEFERLYAAWLQYGVLRIRNQDLDDEQLQAFSQRFGPLEEAPFGRMPEAEKAKIKNRFVTTLSNIKVDGKPIGGLGNDEATWHSDMTYSETPPPASLLLGIEIPDQGGDTHFADQRAALAALPAALRQRIESLSVKHNAAHTSVGKLRPGFEAFDDPRDAPGAIHPMIKTHNETGKPALYLGRREWAYIPGMTVEESDDLLDALWTYVAIKEITWTQQWQPFDLIIWDNRCVMHRRDGFDQNSRRYMRRCQVLPRHAV
ncbi:MAG TPA: taurine catabolism dioxygenase TauD [Gammaproteobacteria bacterium]|jgi:taurine dioxygenase|nr:TauD/TfdA family dioxygenase [Gammaproteobacteria bacterium]MDA0826474.1 TauD/TfdA family dioxygenase [Pseudomonadota bacterium]MDA8534671.1 TauD/TfdA family dioxygenase [Pseudomonadales bacterium]MBT6791277.1 TauD/TfdA family dioxygenase [Gammaproteobacteria bacterium]MCH9785089.1 TauD/TfdA family dioxygenase [Gammaproteobacteria bacterium]